MNHGGGFDWPPVKTYDGRILHHVSVLPGERTCRECGETVAARLDYCTRCSDTDAGLFVRDLVPTESYSRDDEFVTVN